MGAKKPPLGLVPRQFHEESRMNEIIAAKKRFDDAKVPIPQEWIDEYRDLLVDEQIQQFLLGVGDVVDGTKEKAELLHHIITPTKFRDWFSKKYWQNTGKLSGVVYMHSRCDFDSQFILRINDDFFALKWNIFYQVRMEFVKTNRVETL